MNNSFPYWQFDDGKWLTGKIASFDLEGQGLYLQFCMAAWEGHGVFNICSTSLSLRFKKEVDWINKTVKAMIDVKILIKKGDQYRIKFIDEQLADMDELREKRARAGRASAEKRGFPPSPPSGENKINKSNNTSMLKSVQHASNGCSTGVEIPEKKESVWQKTKRLEILDQRWAALKDFTTPEAATIRELRKQLRIEISEGK